MENLVGKVIHYFDKAMVAVIKLNDSLLVGDTIKIKKGEQEITQIVESIEIEHDKIEAGEAGDEVAIKVSDVVKTGSDVYKIV